MKHMELFHSKIFLLQLYTAKMIADGRIRFNQIDWNRYFRLQFPITTLATYARQQKDIFSSTIKWSKSGETALKISSPH